MICNIFGLMNFIIRTFFNIFKKEAELGQFALNPKEKKILYYPQTIIKLSYLTVQMFYALKNLSWLC